MLPGARKLLGSDECDWIIDTLIFEVFARAKLKVRIGVQVSVFCLISNLCNNRLFFFISYGKNHQ